MSDVVILTTNDTDAAKLHLKVFPTTANNYRLFLGAEGDREPAIDRESDTAFFLPLRTTFCGGGDGDLLRGGGAFFLFFPFLPPLSERSLLRLRDLDCPVAICGLLTFS